MRTNSSTTAELVAVDQLLPLVLWTPLFMKSQGYDITENTVYQDNKSAISLEKKFHPKLGEAIYKLSRIALNK